MTHPDQTTAPPAPAPGELDATDAKLIEDLTTAALLVGSADDGTCSSATVARRDAKLDAAKAALSERVAQLVAAARKQGKLLDDLRVAMRAAGPHYHLVNAASERAATAGRQETADQLEYVYGRLFWMDYALGTMAERSNAETAAARASRPTEETDA